MRSTRQFLENKQKLIADQQRHHNERAKDINAQRNANQLPEMAYPDEFLDNIYHTVMHRPMDISLTEDEKIIVDYESLKIFRASKNGHPLNRQPMKPFRHTEPYPEDAELAGRIHAHLTIEELRLYVARCEAARQELLLKELDDKTDQEAKLIFALQQAVSNEAIYRAYGYTHQIPAHFYGTAPYATLMTLPIILDGKYHIDFFELLKTLPDNHVRSSEELKCLEEQACQYKIARIAALEQELESDIQKTPPASDKYPEEERARHIASLKRLHEHKVQSTNSLPIHIIFPTEPQEYCNPFTGEPINSIAINFELLEEIDLSLDPFERQMHLVEQAAHSQQRITQKVLGKTNSYAELLMAEKYPGDKIPESIKLGCMTTDNTNLEVMTHPVLLDGQHLIDLPRLKEFWAPVNGWFTKTPGCRGINPFTKKPIKTITYHDALKEATDNFMLNREQMKGFIDAKAVQNGGYLRRDTPKTYPTLYSGIFHRPRATGLAGLLIESAIEEKKHDTSNTINSSGKN